MKKDTTKKTAKATVEAPVAKSKRRVLEGKVVSNKMTDTIVVEVVRFVKNQKYQKFVKIAKRFKAHDAGNTKQIGDQVSIEECRPISKDKHFKVLA